MKKFPLNIHWLVWIMLGAAVGATGAAILRYRQTFPVLSQDHGTWGQAGDYFGGFLGAGLAFLALLALLWSVHIQQNELSETRKILRDQATEFERQGARETFFRLMALHSNNMTILASGDVHAVMFIRRITDNLIVKLNSVEFLTQGELAQAFSEVNETYEYWLDPYYRTLTSILAFIEGNPHLQDPSFIKILRGQLSIDEQIWIYFAGLSERHASLRRYAIQHKLFDSSMLHRFERRPEMRSYYPADAYLEG